VKPPLITGAIKWVDANFAFAQPRRLRSHTPWPPRSKDAYLLFLNRPPDDVPPGDGGATIVAAGSLHHPELPQPDALRLFDRLARQPARHAGTLVFLSDLTGELANEGLTWPEVGIDYEAVTDGVVALHRRRALRALRLTQLSDVAVTLLASGPHAQVFVAESDGQSPKLLDPILFQVRREELRTMIRTDLERMVARGSFH
jgi:hypothetical protein